MDDKDKKSSEFQKIVAKLCTERQADCYDRLPKGWEFIPETRKVEDCRYVVFDEKVTCTIGALRKCETAG